MISDSGGTATTGSGEPDDESVSRLMYLSRALTNFDPERLADLAEVAALNNRMLGVTGWLTYRANEFVQQLEGPEHEVNELYDRIAADPRHTIVRSQVLPMGARRFDSWSMTLMDPHWLVEWSLEELLNDAVRDLRAVDTGSTTPETVTRLDGRVARTHDELAGRS